jgi:uncharacterized protein YqgC (DUF456 family)
MTNRFPIILRIAMILGLACLLSACTAQPAGMIWVGLQLSNTMQVTLQIVVLVVMLGGLLSLLLVIMPGLTIIWLAAMIYGILTRFNLTGLLILGTITGLMIFGNIIDQILMGAKAKQSGASWTGIFLSMLAALIFSILFPPFGGLAAALIVLFVVEFLRLRNWRKAGESTKEMATGCATAVVARIGIGLVMIGLWLLWVRLGGNWLL